MQKTLPILIVLGVAAGAVLGLVRDGRADSDPLISQKGREFLPDTVTVRKGGRIFIVNDDAPLLHHVFIRSNGMDFDSGEQQPGSVTPISFPEAGTYTVLCGIHPKMLLTVTVEP